MFRRGGYEIAAYVVGVGALESAHGGRTHNGVDKRVFAVVLPDARPARIARHVDGWRVGPGAVRGARLIGGDDSCVVRQRRVERRADIDILGKERAAQSVGCSVVLVEAVDGRDSHNLDRHPVYAGYYLVPLLRRQGYRAGSVEERADLIFRDNVAELGLVEHEIVARAGAEHVDGQFGHLADLLVESHFGKNGIDALLEARVARNGRTDGGSPRGAA